MAGVSSTNESRRPQRRPMQRPVASVALRAPSRAALSCSCPTPAATLRTSDQPCLYSPSTAAKLVPHARAVVENHPGLPFRVCEGCRERLETSSLRPPEWFRLAAVHGWPSRLLHDDFYDDGGNPTAPEVAVVDAADHRFPSKFAQSEMGSHTSAITTYQPYSRCFARPKRAQDATTCRRLRRKSNRSRRQPNNTLQLTRPSSRSGLAAETAIR